MAHHNFTNLRVFIREADHAIYNDLTGRAANEVEDTPFLKMPDLFVAAACLGAKYNQFREFDGKKRDIFVADALDAKTQIPVLIALAYEKAKDFEVLSNSKLVLEICQGWANGGIQALNTELKSGKGLRPLYRLINLLQETV